MSVLLCCFVLSCDDGILNTGAESTTNIEDNTNIENEDKFCQEACEKTTDCTINGFDLGLTCVKNRCMGKKCTDMSECLDPSYPICDKDTSVCVCGPNTCEEKMVCMKNGKCVYECDDNKDCEFFIGDICINGACGCSEAKACGSKTFLDGTTIVCEKIQ